jgi:hypothetical protein
MRRSGGTRYFWVRPLSWRIFLLPQVSLSPLPPHPSLHRFALTVFLSCCSGRECLKFLISDHPGSRPFQHSVVQCPVSFSTFDATSYLLTPSVKSHGISRPPVPRASGVSPLRIPKARSGVDVKKRCLDQSIIRLLPRTVSLRISYQDCITSIHAP